MIKNNTKDKGDTGLIQIIADLDRNGIKVALPISEHLPFDLIAINSEGKLLRISVKYKKLINNAITIPLRSVYSNTKGSFAKTIDFSLIDVIAAYNPDLNKCYYISVEELKLNVSGFVLRLKDAIQRKNRKEIHIAENYMDIHKIFNGKLTEFSNVPDC